MILSKKVITSIIIIVGLSVTVTASGMIPNQGSDDVVSADVTLIQSATSDAISAISIAQDSAVSAINSTKDTAIQQVKDTPLSSIPSSSSAPSSASSQSQTSVPHQQVFIVDGLKKIKWTVQQQPVGGSPNAQPVTVNCYAEIMMGNLDTNAKTLILTLNGYFGGKLTDVTIKNSAGDSLNFTDDGKGTITIPYNSLSDISTVYFCTHGDQIEIKVTE